MKQVADVFRKDPQEKEQLGKGIVTGGRKYQTHPQWAREAFHRSIVQEIFQKILQVGFAGWVHCWAHAESHSLLGLQSAIARDPSPSKSKMAGFHCNALMILGFPLDFPFVNSWFCWFWRLRRTVRTQRLLQRFGTYFSPVKQYRVNGPDVLSQPQEASPRAQEASPCMQPSCGIGARKTGWTPHSTVSLIWRPTWRPLWRP